MGLHAIVASRDIDGLYMVLKKMVDMLKLQESSMSKKAKNIAPNVMIVIET